MIGRHAALRFAFREDHGRPYAILRERVASGLIQQDLTSLPPDEALAESAAADPEEVGRPFDLEAGGLQRCLLYQVGPEHHVLGIVQHHVITDAISLRVFLRSNT